MQEKCIKYKCIQAIYAFHKKNKEFPDASWSLHHHQCYRHVKCFLRYTFLRSSTIAIKQVANALSVCTMYPYIAVKHLMRCTLGRDDGLVDRIDDDDDDNEGKRGCYRDHQRMMQTSTHWNLVLLLTWATQQMNVLPIANHLLWCKFLVSIFFSMAIQLPTRNIECSFTSWLKLKLLLNPFLCN